MSCSGNVLEIARKNSLEALHIGVLRLIRISIGPLELGALRKGSVRPLTEEEKRTIDQALRDGN